MGFFGNLKALITRPSYVTIADQFVPAFFGMFYQGILPELLPFGVKQEELHIFSLFSSMYLIAFQRARKSSQRYVKDELMWKIGTHVWDALPRAYVSYKYEGDATKGQEALEYLEQNRNALVAKLTLIIDEAEKELIKQGKYPSNVSYHAFGREASICLTGSSNQDLSMFLAEHLVRMELSFYKYFKEDLSGKQHSISLEPA